MDIYCILIVVVVVTTAWSVWTRRYTLRSNFERPITLSLAMQCLALWLLCPLSSTSSIGTVLHAITGHWNVDNLIGSLCAIVAAIASFMGNAYRLTDENEVRRVVVQRIVPSATIAIALMLMCFAESNWPTSAHPAPSLLAIPNGGHIWMRAYFVVFIAILGYIGHMALRTLVALYRVAPGARMTISLKIASYAFAALAFAVQLGYVFVPVVRTLDGDGALVWTLLCACVSLAAIGSVWSWKRQLAPFRPLIKATGARF